MKVNKICDTRIIICGGRHFDNYQYLSTIMQKLIENNNLDTDDIEIVSGHCVGTDRLGEQFAQEMNLKLSVFPADWVKYGKAAGPIRNKEMVNYIRQCNKPIVVAFISKNSKGTINTVNMAKSFGIETVIVDYEICDTDAISLQEGVRLSGNDFVFDFENDLPDDIIKLQVTSIKSTKFHKNVIYYGFKINFDSDSNHRKSFLKYIKDNTQDDNVIEIIDRCVEQFYEQNTTKHFDTIISLPSRSKINELMCTRILDKFDDSKYVVVNKKPTSELEFDWKLFKSTFTGDEDYFNDLYRYMNSYLQRLKEDPHFSISKISPRYRRYIKPMIDLGNFDVKNSENTNLLIVDDTFTTGSTLNMLLTSLNEIGFIGNITILTLINNR